ncbi:MAG: acetate--CoA ligase family protein [Prolixibacteraceae bacterium]|jgi:acyl-CoA synthetase (NDP forming)|nr:acetate--CoA ligase family protein [Prolixibacteraceae bacterium]
MINDQLFYPNSIVVVGASNNTEKPGGKLLKNLLDTNYQGKLMVVNPRTSNVQGIESFESVGKLPAVDLAILAIPAELCVDAISILANNGVKAFIVISAGFSEESDEGALLEKQMVAIVDKHNACLIGPNCIGVLAPIHASVFTTPIPGLSKKGVDFISGSGATAVFIMESAIPKGLQFHSVISVGNSSQHGIEDVLAYLDETFDPKESSKIKLLYIENISNPDKLLRHAKSLISKGCRIAAIKAGSSEAGSRAASSHTGAMASSDLAVEALFRKAGIVRCYGREELTTVACIFSSEKITGKNIAIITHAGGPAVMLTDALEAGGLKIPKLKESQAKENLKQLLFSGSSVENPIDFLATGNAQQLESIIDACENDFDEIDAMAVIYGSPGLFPVREVYKTLDNKMKTCKKPIYPILPSVVNVKEDVAYFISSGNVSFPDEVLLGKALTKVYHTPCPSSESEPLSSCDVEKIKKIIDKALNGYQPPKVIHELFEALGILMAKEIVVENEEQAIDATMKLGFPLVMKVVGPIHKSDVKGVSLNINSGETVKKEFNRIMNIEGATAVIIAEMHKGTELFIGAKYEATFGHVMLCGLGGIFVEALKDVTSGLAPLSMQEAVSMIQNIKAYKILEGYRGTKPVNEKEFANILVRLSAFLRYATEIKELDINPLLADGDKIVAVDARIRIEHSS